MPPPVPRLNLIMKNKCSICGKRAKLNCPVNDQPICAFCCGAKRNSIINCPKECFKNPFGDNYDLFLEIEQKLKDVWANFAFSNIDDTTKTEVQEIHNDSSIDENEISSRIDDLLEERTCFEEDDNGITIAQRFEMTELSGLPNDLKYLWKYYNERKGTIFEIQKYTSEKESLCRDYFTNELVRVFDYSLVRAKMSKYSLILVKYYNMPHFTRLRGRATTMWRNLVDEFTKRLKGKQLNTSIHKIIGILSQSELKELVEKIHKQETDKMLESMDFKIYKVLYTIKTSMKSVVKIIDSLPEFELSEAEIQKPFTIEYMWLRLGKSKKFEQIHGGIFQRNESDGLGTGILASIRLNSEIVEIETISRKKYEFCLKMMKRYLGNDIKFERKLVVDADTIAKNKPKNQESDDDKSFVNEIPPEIQSKLQKKFLNDNIPALDNLTPREASKREDCRENLVELMKSHLSRSPKEAQEGIVWALKQLGLKEMID